MPQINMESILAKAQAYTATDAFQKKMSQKVDDVVMHGGSLGITIQGQNGMAGGASMAAAKFIEVLQSEIQSTGMGSTAISALTQLEHGAPRKVGNNLYQIEVWFSNDLHRQSLNPDKYDDINNLAALLNNGYDANGIVSGTWHGKQIYSLQHRDGAHFIESAIHNYMSNYASEYGVVDITAAGDYGIRS